MAPPRPPRDPKRPPKPRGGSTDGADKRAKSPSAAARDARRAEQHAATRPPRAPAKPVAPAPAAPDRRRNRPTAATKSADRPAAAPRPAPPARQEGRTERPQRPARDPVRGASRTDRSAAFADRPARPERSERPARTDQRERPVRTDRAPRADRPVRADRPDRGERPAFATRADRADRPTRAAPADRGPPRRPPARAAERPARAEAPRRGAARHERPPAAPRSVETSAPGEGQRIAKLLARAGIASRREIERMIEEGRIAIGGVAIDTAATILKSLHGVTVDGNAVQAAAPARLFRYHKPAGLLTAERDPAGRATIYDRLPPGLPRVIPVGRLDLNTEGLLLLTTDGELKRQLELPATGVERTYRARVFGDISQAQLEDLIDGIEIEGVRYGQIDANLERRTGRNGWVEMRLREGKNREVRRVLEFLGLQVSRLIRTAYGPFTLEDMMPGDVDEVRQHDLVAFRKMLK